MGLEDAANIHGTELGATSVLGGFYEAWIKNLWSVKIETINYGRQHSPTEVDGMEGLLVKAVWRKKWRGKVWNAE